MTKPIILAAALALTGCATAPGTPVTASMAERAYALHEPQQQTPSWRDACYALSGLEGIIRRARTQGMSADAQRAMIAVVAVENGDADTQRGTIAGIISFQVIDHVYAGRTDSAVNRCLDERWPQMAYLATR